MNRELRVLMLEDTLTDAELAEHELRKAGLAFTSIRVETRDAFIRALEEFRPDIILSDYKLPDFNGMAALEIVQRDHPEVPVIMVTGALSDIEAVELIHAGARDYVLKDRLARLESAVRRALSVEQGVRARKTAEKALQESEARYRRITEGLTDYQYTVRVEDGHAVKTTQSPACVTVTGYKPEEFGTNSFLWMQMVAPEDRELVMEHVRHILAGKDVPPIEHRIIRKDGETRWVSDTTILFKDASGKLLSYDGVIKDITERKQAEEQLRKERDFAESLINTAPTIVLVLDTQGCIVRINPYMETLSGYTLAEVKGKDWFTTFLPKTIQEQTKTLFFKAIDNIQTVGNINNIVTRSGQELIIEWYDKTIKDTDGNILGLLVIGQDITERKQAEIALNHANRALATVSAVNRHLVYATEENELLQAICRAIIEQRGYRMASVGYAQQDVDKTIKIMAHAGHDDGYLKIAQLSWAEDEHGMGPSGRAIRSGKTQLCQDIANDPHYLLWRDAALQQGYVASIALPLADGKGKVFGILTVYAEEVNAFSADEIELLEEMAGDLAFGVRALHIRHERDLALEQNQHYLVQLHESLDGTVRAIASIVEMRDPYTAGHQVRVADLATAIAIQMGLPDEQKQAIHLASIVHDLGKIIIPAEILSKPGQLNDIEYRFIKNHPQAGYNILKDISFPWPIAQMVLQHHERLDGSGYPQGLKAGAIMLEARILSVADVVEAMSSHRPYRPALGTEAALAEIAKQRDICFDPQVVDACLTLFRNKEFVFKA